MTLAIMAICEGNILCQNLVPNPSFECGVDICPPNQVAGVVNACEWNCPNRSTPDIFSTQLQNKSCYSSVPYNGTDPFLHYGSQIPRTGNRFAGIYAWDQPGKTLYREYLQVKLKSPLVPGEYYCAELFASLAEIPLYAANNLGMYFSDQEIKVPNSGANLPFTPQILEKKVISDTANWVRVAGTFQANSAAQYLIIGNFFENENTQTVFQATRFNDDYYGYAFFFIDDVSVEKLPYKEFVFSGSQTICEGESTTIKAEVGVDEVKWSTLPDTSIQINQGKTFTVSPLITTSYRVKAQSCRLTIIDTVTVYVNPRPKIDLGRDSVICTSTRFELDAGPGYNEYRWQDNSISQRLVVSGTNRYSVTVKDKFGCVGKDEVMISRLAPPVVELGMDTLICSTYFPLRVSGRGNYFKWKNNSNDSTFTPEKSGKYWVTVGNRCGETADTINIYSLAEIFIPNVITPNGDRQNEKFTFNGIGENWSASLKIFNRWGNEIYFSNGYHGEWPLPAQMPEAGTYYFLLEFAGCRSYKGWLQIIR